MNARDRFIDVIKKGSNKPYVSFQIGAGAGFDCKLVGKEWISQGTIEDTVRAYDIVGCDGLITVGLPDLGNIVRTLKWSEKVDSQPDAKIITKILNTPYGDISWQFKEQKKHGLTPIKYPLVFDSENLFDIVDWYAQQHLLAIGKFGELLNPIVEQAHKAGTVCIQWNVQPFELMGLVSVENLAMLAMLNKERFRNTCKTISDVNLKLTKEVFASGADFIFLGGPGSEMLSPNIYREYLIPDSQVITNEVEKQGGLVYTHICSPIEPFLSMGFYNEMGLGLFETFSPPPVGNVESLAKARNITDSKICTRGNIGLDVLLNGSQEEIEKATFEVIEATKGTKHMIAASDYLFYDIPLKNIKQVIKIAESI